VSEPSKFCIPVDKPEWLSGGLEHAEKVFRLAREGKIPESILGWMLRTACLRVLRWKLRLKSENRETQDR